MKILVYRYKRAYKCSLEEAKEYITSHPEWGRNGKGETVRTKTSLVCGVGVNDADYKLKTYIGGKRRDCPYYERWRGMLRRCYNTTKTADNSYLDCYVCEEWLTFSSFRSWMEKQEWKGRQLDKDLKVEGNKVYSPDTCMFLPSSLNASLTQKNILVNIGLWGVEMDYFLRKRLEAIEKLKELAKQSPV